MNATERSELYFKTYGEPALSEAFPEVWARAAAGVFGPGSDNFGFDDPVSADHDVDPGFFVFLDETDYKEWEFRLSRAYDKLPRAFEGAALIGESAYGTSRHGVRETGAFFKELLGRDTLPETNAEWLSVPETALACAVNGKIFYDGPGKVTAIREHLSKEPEDVRRKKLARYLVFAAQAGQYNYARLLRHNERGAAVVALGEFAQNVCRAVYKLNFAYPPFYKWLLRGAKALPLGAEAAKRCETMLLDPLGESVPAEIEAVAALLIEELRRQDLTDLPFDYLEPHAKEVLSRVTDPELRFSHVME
ncbi:MAG: DUF4037 domain-containing protein [Clostridia bacterium]|nr:DUF4037 domain-containing protein [Clostridia bacterium]